MHARSQALVEAVSSSVLQRVRASLFRGVALRKSPAAEKRMLTVRCVATQ